MKGDLMAKGTEITVRKQRAYYEQFFEGDIPEHLIVIEPTPVGGYEYEPSAIPNFKSFQDRPFEDEVSKNPVEPVNIKDPALTKIDYLVISVMLAIGVTIVGYMTYARYFTEMNVG